MATIYDTLSATRTLRSKTLAEWDITLAQTPIERIVTPAGSSASVYKDANLLTYADAVVDTSARVSVTEAVQGSLGKGYRFASSNTNIATVDAVTGEVTRVADGAINVICITPWRRRQEPVAVHRSSTTSVQFQNFVTGSLARHCADQVDTRIAGKSPLVAEPLFEVLNHATATYRRNTSCWCFDVNMTCKAVWNSSHNNAQQGGTLITPRHIVAAQHYPFVVGQTLRFATANGPGNANCTVVTRTVTDVANPSGDVQVCKLDADVPNTISFAKILPSGTFDSKIPGAAAYGAPGLCTNQQNLALTLNARSSGSCAIESAETQPLRYSFGQVIIKGDSGSPFGMIINGEFVLLGCWESGGAYPSGPSLSGIESTLNSCLTSLGGGYQMTLFDTSAFPSY